MTEEPQWRLRNPVESEEEDEVEEGRNSGDKPPVEESSQAVGGQYSQANHQSKQGEKSSPSLDRTSEIPRDFYFVISALTCTEQQEGNSLKRRSWSSVHREPGPV